MVLVASRGISRVPRYSGTCREPVVCRLPGCHRLWPIVPDRSTSRLVAHSLALKPDRPYNPTVHARWFRYWRNHYCFLFLQVLRWFTSLRCLLTAYVFSGGSFGISQRGFPHSETPGSKLICSSPGLIAAYRVLHRLLVPRHSPYTLSSLTIRNSSSRLAYATRQLHAHCVCVVGKNYRLQSIQLSKIERKMWRIPGSNR